MGNCSPNRLENYQNISHYYDVYNVDARLLKQNKGRIQITKYAMILYQKNEMPIIWPLSAIRKFGSHKDIFLFESGRRCLTGEGMFAFKCKQSKSIEDCLKKITNGSKKLCNLRSTASDNDNESSSSCNNTNNNIDQTLNSENTNLNKTLNQNRNNISDNNPISSSFSDSNKINTDKTKNILNVTAESINSTRKESEPAAKTNDPKETNIVPYYVNFDAASKIGSPINLSVTNLNCSLKRARTDYVNSEEINPTLLNLAKKINGETINSPKSINEDETFEEKLNNPTSSASSFSISSIRSKNKSCKKILDVLTSASTSSKLNYIIPERILNNKTNLNNNIKIDDQNTVINGVTGKLNDLEEENEDQYITQIQSKEHIRDTINEVEYLVIDLKKTPAIKSSTMLLNQRRKEYLTLNIK